MSARPPITPATRVGELLETYPELEEVLVKLAPPFAKLRNPVLRRTIARVTSLERAAAVADIPLRELIGTLREAAGQTGDGELPAAGPSTPPAAADSPPDWVDRSRVVWTLDADLMLEQGIHPVAEVQRRSLALSGNELGLVRASFRPAPLFDLLAQQGLRAAVVGSAGAFELYIGR